MKDRHGMPGWLPPAAAALVALIVMAPSLGNGFVFDDVWIVEQRPLLHDPPSLGALLTEPFWPAERGAAMWRPGALAAFAAEWAAGRGSPAVFHAVNILVYGALAALVALLAGTLFGPPTGLIAGILYAAHPVHVEAAANVVGQAELLPAVCYLAVLLLAWRHARGHGGAGYPLVLGVLALTAVGMSFKEHMVTLPGALAVLWWYRYRGEGTVREVLGREWRILAAVVVPILAYLVVRGGIAGPVSVTGGPPPGVEPGAPLDRILVMLPVSLEWLRLLFLPVALSADYGPAHRMPQLDPGLIHLAAVALWAGLLGAAWRVRRTLPAVTVGVGLFVVTVSVVSNIVIPLEVWLAERFLLLPSVGWAVVLGGLGAASARRGAAARAAVVGATVAVTVLFGWRAIERVPVWRNNETFFAQLERDAPESYRIAWMAANEAVARGDSARGEALLLEALRRNPWHAGMQEQLALHYITTGRYGPAIPLLARVLERDPYRDDAMFGLAVALTKEGRGEEALRWLDRVEERRGPSPPLTVARIEALRVARRYAESVATAEAALRDRPDDWYLHLMAAESALLGGLCDKARSQAETGMRAAPEDRLSGFLRVLDHLAKGDAACK